MLTETEHKLKPSVGLSPERHITLGRTTRIVVPLSSSLSASTRPPCSCAMCFTIARPRPVPLNFIGTACFICAVEALENARQILFGDADAIIAHSQLDFTVALPGAQPYLAVLARIFHGVIEQIVEGFL